jgi:beta-phosphoglucomutase-like phosphatase (HAD superfamily)
VRIEAVIFDCDGVLVDSEPISNRVLADMLNELGLRFTVEDAMSAFLGKAVREEVAAIEALLGRGLPAGWYDGYAARRDAALAIEVRAVPGVGEVLEAIARRGLPYAVASGADRSKMRVTLGATRLLAHFEAPGDAAVAGAAAASAVARAAPPRGSRLFGADMVARAKPAPDVYLLAAAALQVAPDRCAVIEDTAVGAAAGVAAGAAVLGYCAHTDPRALLAAGACAVFDDMRRLPALLAI